MSNAKKALDIVMGAFELVYDQRVAQAMHNLGGMAVQEDYPSFDQFKAQTSLTYDFTQVPAGGDWDRSSIPAELADRMANRTQAATERAAQGAVQSALVRLAKPLASLCRSVSPPEEGAKKVRPIFDSVLENVKVMCRNLRDFNIYQDADIALVVQTIEQEILQYDLATLKKSQAAKTDV